MSCRLLLFSFALLTSAGAVAAGDVSNESIVQQNYPAESLERGEQGTVSFSVALDRDARIESCVVTQSSGYLRLDEATCDLIVKFAKFAPAQADGARVATTRTGKLVWKLPDAYRQKAASAPAPVAATAAQLEAQRLICKRQAAPGSVIRVKTHCLTRDEWDQAQENSERAGRDMIPARQSDHSCPNRC